MNGAAETKQATDETKLSLRLIRKKVITEGQLKAALDYQRSLGGRITDILIKLDMLRPSQVEELLRKDDDDDDTEDEGLSDGSALDPASVKLTDLKVHRRLLDKIPQDLVEKHLLLVFFPLPSSNSRRIILGHGKPIGADVVTKVRAVAGVELCTLSMEIQTAKGFLAEHWKTEGTKKPTAPAPRQEELATDASGDDGSDEALLHAVVSALLRKGVLSREDIEAELRRRQ